MNEPVPEFSRIIHVERLSPAGLEDVFEPKPAERVALAKRFDLIDLPRLSASLTVKPELRGTVAVKGRIEADVVQRCVVTLEPIHANLAIKVAMIFVPEDFQGSAASAPEAEIDEEDYDTYENHRIDLGEMIAQYLGISLDPYPRKPDAALSKTEFGADPSVMHPFARLAELTRKDKK